MRIDISEPERVGQIRIGSIQIEIGFDVIAAETAQGHDGFLEFCASHVRARCIVPLQRTGMIHFMLDTNTCIYFLNRASENIIRKMKTLSPADIKLSTITVAELFVGAEKSQAKKKNWGVVKKFTQNFKQLPFDAQCCQNYAKIRARLEKAGTPIGPMDLLIAAIAKTHGLVLVTNNLKEFRRFKEISLENWI